MVIEIEGVKVSILEFLDIKDRKGAPKVQGSSLISEHEGVNEEFRTFLKRKNIDYNKEEIEETLNDLVIDEFISVQKKEYEGMWDMVEIFYKIENKGKGFLRAIKSSKL
ncbi:MAG: hypothetical protein KAJ51_03485 [Thermoplasmata archaeon]|nr:hypothetical protein [Thermoplasmata archaeon]